MGMIERERAIRMRRFPDNTCPASRHVELMADSLMNGGRYIMFDEDPEHCAASLYSVVASLWEARNRLDEAGLGHKPDAALKEGE